MLGIHLPDGTFLELVPWAGQVGGWNGCERVTSLSPTSTRPVWLTWGAVGLNCRLPADQGAWLSVSSCVHAWNTWIQARHVDNESIMRLINRVWLTLGTIASTVIEGGSAFQCVVNSVLFVHVATVCAGGVVC